MISWHVQDYALFLPVNLFTLLHSTHLNWLSAKLIAKCHERIFEGGLYLLFLELNHSHCNNHFCKSTSFVFKLRLS